MRSTAATPALLCLALLVGASGCGGGPSTVKADPTRSSATPSARPTAPSRSSSIPSAEASTPPFAADVKADEGGLGSGNGLGLTGVRVARHPGFDRVVFDLGGTGTPGWRVAYTPRPRADGSGHPVRVKGTVFLQVALRGLGLPDDTGVAPYGDSTTRVSGAGTQGVVEIAPGAVFEGQQEAFIGLSGAERPFRVFALENPARVVVDIRDH